MENFRLKKICDSQRELENEISQFLTRLLGFCSYNHRWFERRMGLWRLFQSLTNVRACEPEPLFASFEPLLASYCFFPYLSIFSPFFILTVFWSLSREHLKVKIWKNIKNKQAIAWKVLCTLFTHWCVHLQPGRIYCCQSISVGSSNFFGYIGSMIRVKKRPTRNIHITTQSSTALGKTRNSTI